MTIFDNYEVWFVIGSQHLYGPEALRQVTKHAEHVVNSLNAEAKLPCKLVLKPLGTTPAYLLTGENVDQRPHDPE